MSTSRDEKFWSMVDKRGPDECWLWKAGKTGDGYGQFCWEGKILYAHRVVREIVDGKPLPDSEEAIHSCDNPPCCNPLHVSGATHLQNMLDKVAKNRHNSPKGEAAGMSKMTVKSVSQLRLLYATQQFTFRTLGKHFGISNREASEIARRGTWRDVNENEHCTTEEVERLAGQVHPRRSRGFYHRSDSAAS